MASRPPTSAATQEKLDSTKTEDRRSSIREQTDGPYLGVTLCDARDGTDTGSAAVHDEGEIKRLTITIARIQQTLCNLEQGLLGQITDSQLYEIIQRHETLSRNLEVMKNKRRSLEWRKLAQTRAFGFSPDNMESIRGICKEIGGTMTVIAAFSATVSVSILFSAVRGNILFFYASWWCAIISLTSSLALGVLRDTKRIPSSIDWLKLHLSGVVALMCLLAAIASVIPMCYGVIFLDTSNELPPKNEQPHVSHGPTVPKGVKVYIIVTATIIVAIFFAGALVPFIRPFQVAHQSHWAHNAEQKRLEEKRRSVV